MSDRTVSVLRTHDDRQVPVAGVYEIDGAHTSVEFVGRHLMITKVRGRFSDVRGRITIAEEPENSHVDVEIGAASLSTGNDDRDAHLKSADFFDVEHFPTITFRSTAVKALRRQHVGARRRSDRPWHHPAGHVAGGLRRRRRSPRSATSASGSARRPTSTARTSGSPGTWRSRPAALLVGKNARIELSVQAIAARAGGRRLTLPSPRGVDRHARNHR